VRNVLYKTLAEYAATVNLTSIYKSSLLAVVQDMNLRKRSYIANLIDDARLLETIQPAQNSTDDQRDGADRDHRQRRLLPRRHLLQQIVGCHLAVAAAY